MVLGDAFSTLQTFVRILDTVVSSEMNFFLKKKMLFRTWSPSSEDHSPKRPLLNIREFKLWLRKRVLRWPETIFHRATLLRMCNVDDLAVVPFPNTQGSMAGPYVFYFLFFAFFLRYNFTSFYVAILIVRRRLFIHFCS